MLLKAAARPNERLTYAVLGNELSMSPSEVHASGKRAATAGLAVRVGRARERDLAKESSVEALRSPGAAQ